MDPPLENNPDKSQEAGQKEGDDSNVSPAQVSVDDPTKPSPAQVGSDEDVPMENAPTSENLANGNQTEQAPLAEGAQGNTVDKSGGQDQPEKEQSDDDDKTETENDNNGAEPLEMDVDKPVAAAETEKNNKMESSEFAENPVISEEEEEEEEEAVAEAEITLTEKENKIKSGNGSLEKDESKVVVDAEAEAAEEEEMEDNNRFDYWSDGNESGDEEDQTAFMRELEIFYKGNNFEFKPPKFYGSNLNLLKLWRHVIKLGCYEKVTCQKLWRIVGEAFNPPKTCTTVSWTFRIFYEKALLEYEKHKIRIGDIEAEMPDLTPLPLQVIGTEGGSGSGRARRDAATRAMEGWHSQRPLGNGQVSDPFIKGGGGSQIKRDKFVKTSGGSLKRKKPEESDNKIGILNKSQLDVSIVDAGLPADWVKINVKKNKDCYEVYALVPGLLREEVQVKSDPAGRLILSGEPEQADNPWGVTSFKKVITLPSAIDPHQTSAVVTLHGQLYVRAPFPTTN